MIIVVTGAFGFIGSNLVKALNKKGYTDIIAVDNLTDGVKCNNLVDCEILDFVDKKDFLEAIIEGNYDNQIDYIFHQGACSDTTLLDGRYMLKNNYEYSSILLDYAQKNEVPLVYASSAAVYGASNTFIEEREYESPLNPYGYSKFLFDQIVRRHYANGLTAPIVGLRYFNVYGPREKHKGRMASVVWHNFCQYKERGKVKLFTGCQGYANGEQVRDFISVEDVIKVNMFFFDNHLNDIEEISGIFNCGTGVARSFNELALGVINACRYQQGLDKMSLLEAVNSGTIEYIDFPADLAGRYQCYTQANLKHLYQAGFKEQFLTLEDGISNYLNIE